MRLLHVSDIHFRSPDCNDPDHDPERPYRTKLMQDARNLASQDGQAVQAILVGGDIAYRGAAAEYDAALAWLEELAKECGCPIERVFVIPGNHDVDRSVITSTPSVRNVQKAIADAAPQRRERELHRAHRGQCPAHRRRWTFVARRRRALDRGRGAKRRWENEPDRKPL